MAVLIAKLHLGDPMNSSGSYDMYTWLYNNWFLHYAWTYRWEAYLFGQPSIIRTWTRESRGAR